MKKSLSCLLISWLFAGLIWAVEPVQKASETHYLFVMGAAEATLDKGNGGLRLHLKNLDKKTLYFSDRPIRKAGLISTQAFMADWLQAKNTFQINPPNAAIILDKQQTGKNGLVQAVAVELKSPSILDDGSLVFKVTDLEGKLLLGEYKDVSIFIDSIDITGRNFSE